MSKKFSRIDYNLSNCSRASDIITLKQNRNAPKQLQKSRERSCKLFRGKSQKLHSSKNMLKWTLNNNAENSRERRKQNLRQVFCNFLDEEKYTKLDAAENEPKIRFKFVVFKRLFNWSYLTPKFIFSKNQLFCRRMFSMILWPCKIINNL